MDLPVQDTDAASFTDEQQALLERTVRRLKVARLRVPDPDDIDSGDLVDFFNHLALVHDIDCLDSPTWVNWDITSRCNCACVHCAASALHDPDNAGTDETSTAQAIELVDEMAAAGVLTVVLSGGEPFLRRDLYVILDRLKQRRLFVTILTNGSLDIDLERLEAILDPEADLIQVSLDGPDAASHDRQRGARVFDRTIAMLRRLVRSSLPVKANMVLTEANVESVYEVYHLVRELGVPTVSFTVNCPVGRGEDIPAIDAQQLLRISMNLHRLSEIHPQPAIRNNVLLLPYAVPQIRRLIEPDGRRPFPRFRCLAGTAKAVVDSRGDLYPCPFLLYPAFKAGNVFQRGLYALWNDPATWVELRQGRRLDEHKCGRCGYVNRCRGECPGAAYGATRTIHAPDPRCTLELEPEDGGAASAEEA